MILSFVAGALLAFVATCVMFYLDESHPSAKLKQYICEGKR